MLFPFPVLAKAPTLRLSPLFTDGAVVQRGIDVPVFGFATPGAFVNVEVAGQRAGATADVNGRWIVRMKPLKVGGSYILTASSAGETVSARDILSGEVWIASGQSNMEFPESGADDFARAQSEAKGDVRMFTVEKATAAAPLNDLKGRWEPATPNTIGHFSAVALSFARELNRKLGVPVGIIHTSWGGTPAEAWTSREALVAKPALKHYADAVDAAQKDYPAQMAAYKRAMGDFVNFKHGREQRRRDAELADPRLRRRRLERGARRDAPAAGFRRRRVVPQDGRCPRRMGHEGTRPGPRPHRRLRHDLLQRGACGPHERRGRQRRLQHPPPLPDRARHRARGQERSRDPRLRRGGDRAA